MNLEVTCSYLLTRIICFSYIYQVTTRADSRHFDSPAERRHFEDVAGIVENRCIEYGSSSMGVDGQTTVGVFYFLTSPAVNDTLRASCSTSGTGSLNSVEI